MLFVCKYFFYVGAANIEGAVAWGLPRGMELKGHNARDGDRNMPILNLTQGSPRQICIASRERMGRLPVHIPLLTQGFKILKNLQST